MPEMRFTVRWPDGATESCYSPSLVIREHMAAGESYPVGDFLERSRTALNIASERVRAKYGFACSSALEQLARIETQARRFSATADARVAVLSFEE
ncbi:MSMEG_0570 family nitrogen starvation response protein [Methylopila henanensis]|uniref:MSMEG_0570 family nitrogen starvation response protein n=1 Tax=Methylopila henanensis TaxID=873516 RepID=A0ABW4K2U1_9HYPH